MKNGVVIIYYNPDKSVLDMLEIYSSKFEHVLIFDNSPVPLEEIVRECNEFENVECILNYSNKGISKALEYAFNWAKSKKIDYLLTMDQDSKLSANAIENMFVTIEQTPNDDIAIFAMNYAKIYYDKNGSEVVSKLIQDVNVNKNVKFSMTSGSFFNVKHLHVQMNIPNYFIGFVDQDICYRYLVNGLKILRVGKSYFYQQVGSQKSNSIINKLFQVVSLSNVRYYYMFRNLEYLRKEYKQYKVDFLYYKIRLLFNLIFFESNKREKFRMIKKGVSDYKKGLLNEYEV